mmetsp:Transcript_89025/g.254894  ORF Transcript_89025/g.254894 Transcript_89025/m.254894 type:complete len:210 (+) Transcript_89025:441-1070(+)
MVPLHGLVPQTLGTSAALRWRHLLAVVERRHSVALPGRQHEVGVLHAQGIQDALPHEGLQAHAAHDFAQPAHHIAAKAVFVPSPRLGLQRRLRQRVTKGPEVRDPALSDVGHGGLVGRTVRVPEARRHRQQVPDRRPHPDGPGGIALPDGDSLRERHVLRHRVIQLDLALLHEGHEGCTHESLGRPVQPADRAGSELRALFLVRPTVGA